MSELFAGLLYRGQRRGLLGFVRMLLALVNLQLRDQHVAKRLLRAV